MIQKRPGVIRLPIRDSMADLCAPAVCRRPYQYGGSDPHRCGIVPALLPICVVSTVAAGITLNRSSRGQAQEKKSVQIRCPGDLCRKQSKY